MWTKELPKTSGFYFYIDRLTKEKMIVEVSIEEDRFTMWKHGNELPLNFNYAIGGLFWSDPIVFPDKPSTDWLECDDCGEKKEDVKETICPYDEDRKGIITKCKLCKLCYHERCMQRY